MLNATSTQYLDKYCSNLIAATGISDPSKQFNIAAPIETKLREAILHSVAFLGMISVIPVDQIKGRSGCGRRCAFHWPQERWPVR